MGIMNSVEAHEAQPILASLRRELSDYSSHSNITWLFRDRYKVTLNFGRMPAGKFTAVALLADTDSKEVVTDLNRMTELFVAALQLNYAHGVLETELSDSFNLDIQLNPDIWEADDFVSALKCWLLLAEIHLAPSSN